MFEINPTTLDIAIIVFCVCFALIGYFKGFIKRAYDLFGMFVVIFLSYFLSSRVSESIQLSSMPSDNLFFPIINRITAFFILLFILTIIKKFLGFFIKPLLDDIISITPITEKINKFLGLLLSIIESIIISYLALHLVLTPIVKDGVKVIEQTKVSKIVLNIVPQYSNILINMQENNDLLSDTIINDTTVSLLLDSYNVGIINQKQMIGFIENKLKNELLEGKINLEEKNSTLIELIRSSSLTEIEKEKMINYLK